MANKLNYQLLTARISVATIKELFVKEAQFLRDQIWFFTEQQPQVLMNWNNGSLMLSELQAIRDMMQRVAAQDEAQRQQAEKDAEWEKSVAENKARQAAAAIDPRSLTSSTETKN